MLNKATRAEWQTKSIKKKIKEAINDEGGKSKVKRTKGKKYSMEEVRSLS